MGFRNDFVWGAATASYQIEGAYKEDGKGLNIWDEFTHQDGKILFNHNGDIACDHYHKVEEDVKLMSEIGIKAYRFSISWARIIPAGTGKINQKGIDFYNKLIDELLKYNITPFVTIYHWDLPYELHLKGGWLNEEISEWFEDYTKVIAQNFGDRVKNFITFNESEVFTGCGYWQGVHAPGFKLSDKDLLKICHNILLAHGKAVRVIREKVKDSYIGFTSAYKPQCPVSEKDVEAVRKASYSCGRGNFIFAQRFWLDPIVFGKYPEEILRDYKDEMPLFTDEDMKIISTPIDFIGINTYEGFLMKDDGNGNSIPAYRKDGFPRTAIGWDVVPSSLYWAPKFLYDRYKMPIFITENGMSCHDVVSLDGKVHDPNRIDYLNRYLLELKKAVDDGVDVRGYFQWSLMDNFEWARGYEERFGLIYVDYETKKRTIKDSAYWYRNVIETNGKL